MNQRMCEVYCQKCNWQLKVPIIDEYHPDVSTDEPKKFDVYEDIVKMKKECRNPQCKHEFLVYYFRKKPKAVFKLR